MADPTPNAQAAVESAGHLFDTTVKFQSDHGVNPRTAEDHAARSAADHVREWLKPGTAISGAMAYGVQALAVIFATITSAKKNNRSDFADLSNEIVSDLFQTEIKASSSEPITNATGAQQFDNALGKPVMDMIEQIILNGADPTHVDGEQGARTFLGFGMQFAVTSGFVAVLAETLSLGEFKEWATIGDEMIKALGLGRLNRMAFAPLMQNAIQKPYDHKMRAKYRQDMIAPAELIREFLAGRMTETQCDAFLSQHGFSDDFIAALKAQHTPSLKESEIEELQALGAIDATNGAGQLKEQGIPDSIAGWRMQVLTRKRLEHLRNHILSEVLSQINAGFAQPADIDKWLSSLQIPQDEATMWRQAAGLAAERTRKRLSQGEMLYLYEAAQITDQEVRDWAKAEGYSDTDKEQIVTYFQLKAVEASHKTTGGAAARAAHLHKEHIAYVTDEITGLWGRAPSKAELTYWVNLLDTAERTKHDFLTELKALDTNGPAIPAS